MPELLAFPRKIARLTLFEESELFKEQVASAIRANRSRWLTAQNETLESLILKARKLSGVRNSPAPARLEQAPGRAHRS